MGGMEDPVIIMGDFNAHHSLWGSGTNTRNGIVLNEYVQGKNWALLNNGSPTRMGNNEHGNSILI